MGNKITQLGFCFKLKRLIQKKNKRVKVGISVGDLNGIGIEVILKSLADNRILDWCTPIIYCNPSIISFYQKKLSLTNFNFSTIKTLEDVKPKQINVINCWENDLKLNPGEIDDTLGQFAYLSLKSATDDIKSGNIDALVTAPINKKTIQSDAFNFAGHTEYLQSEDDSEQVLMLMVSDLCRIGVVTGHIPIKEVSAQLKDDLILQKITLLNKSLKNDFGIRAPKIAVLGLNPHAGDDGLIGDEDKNVILPAIKQAKSINILAFGPFPADGFFASANYLNFDGILAMYHDQGLIPAKSFSLGSGINYTAGLSFVRTSPDHGTAYEIAGKSKANESSFRNAIYKACDIVRQRNLQAELESNPLPIQKVKNS